MCVCVHVYVRACVERERERYTYWGSTHPTYSTVYKVCIHVHSDVFEPLVVLVISFELVLMAGSLSVVHQVQCTGRNDGTSHTLRTSLKLHTHKHKIDYM